jgi:hypothetical protein
VGIEEFVLEIVEGVLVEVKLTLECPVRHALPLTEEVNNLIKDGVKVHRRPCSPCGSDTGLTAAHGPVRVNMGSRYHKWPGKESGKCARECPGYLGRPGDGFNEGEEPPGIAPLCTPLTLYPLPEERRV